MSNVKLSDKALALLHDFCDAEMLQNRIELIDDVKDRLLMELGESDDEDERRLLTDRMISLSELKEDLKQIRRTLE